MTSELIRKCCDIAKQYDCRLSIDGPDSDSNKYLVECIDDEGQSNDEYPAGKDEDLDEALKAFISDHEDDDEFEGDDEDDDDS
jgi:hypothetical protein